MMMEDMRQSISIRVIRRTGVITPLTWQHCLAAGWARACSTSANIMLPPLLTISQAHTSKSLPLRILLHWCRLHSPRQQTIASSPEVCFSQAHWCSGVGQLAAEPWLSPGHQPHSCPSEPHHCLSRPRQQLPFVPSQLPPWPLSSGVPAPRQTPPAAFLIFELQHQPISVSEYRLHDLALLHCLDRRAVRLARSSPLAVGTATRSCCSTL